ncbi:hypothetical protein GmHk_09G025470 [Glycine max]|nr:hypothetical protein GmHk_09G025470 [Glycine max]
MSPPPLGPLNHSQTQLTLSRRLPFPALVSADLHTTKSLKLSGIWTSLSRTEDMQELLKKNGQTPSLNLISGLNRWLCSCSCA